MTDHMETPGLPEENTERRDVRLGMGVLRLMPACRDRRSGDGWHDAQLDFSESMSYGDYLSLGTVLDAQHPLSPGSQRDAVHHSASDERVVDEARAV